MLNSDGSPQARRQRCEYSPASEGIKHITVNDQRLLRDRLYISGFDTASLPFL